MTNRCFKKGHEVFRKPKRSKLYTLILTCFLFLSTIINLANHSLQTVLFSFVYIAKFTSLSEPPKDIIGKMNIFSRGYVVLQEFRKYEVRFLVIRFLQLRKTRKPFVLFLVFSLLFTKVKIDLKRPTKTKKAEVK